MKTLVLLALLAAPLAAQQRRQPCMLMEETRQLDFFLGRWKVLKTGTKEVVAHSSVSIASGGCAVTEDWIGVHGDEAHTMNFYNPANQEWQQIYVGSANSPSRIQFYLHGALRDGAMRFEADVPTTTGNTIKVRLRLRNLGDRVQQIHETSLDGTKWVTDYDYTYTHDNEK